MTDHGNLVAGSRPKSLATFDPKAYWEKRLTEYPGLCGVGSTLFGLPYVQWLYKIRRVIFLRLVQTLDLDLQTANVFDIGSGSGFYLELWRQVGTKSVTGCDLTDTAISRLRETFPWARILRMDIGEPLTPAEAGLYDVVSAFDVLFHIVDAGHYQQAIQNAHSLLQPGGLFIFSDLLVHGKPIVDDHMVCRSLDEIVSTLSKVGFEVVCRVPMFVIMEIPHDTANRLYRFLWKLLAYAMRRSELVGLFVGGALYPLELVLTKVCRESPTTEIVVCRKRPGGTSST